MNIGEVPPLQNEKVSLYRDLSALLCFHSYSLGYSRYLAPILQKVDNVIHCINSYSVENAIGFPNTYTNSDSWIVLSDVGTAGAWPYTIGHSEFHKLSLSK